MNNGAFIMHAIQGTSGLAWHQSSTSAPAMIPTSNASGAIIPAFEVHGDTALSLLVAPLAAAAALPAIELNDVNILDSPLPLNVANCADTLEGTILALELAILAIELIDAAAILVMENIIDRLACSLDGGD